MTRLFSAEMDSRKAATPRRRPDSLIWPDENNNDPFTGLPDDLPSLHSRFPIVPSSGYGDLCFDPSLRQNGAAEEDETMTPEELIAWRVAMRRVLGNLVPVSIHD